MEVCGFPFRKRDLFCFRSSDAHTNASDYHLRHRTGGRTLVRHIFYLFDSCVRIRSLDAVREYHDQARVDHHVFAHVRIVAGQHEYCLFARHSLAHVALVVPPVILARLQ